MSAEAVKAAARACRFALVGLAPATALDDGPLRRWLAAGYAADMHWMGERLAERLDPRQVLAGARTVIALGIPYGRADDGAQPGQAGQGNESVPAWPATPGAGTTTTPTGIG